jgi:hypothetical protein
LSVVAALDRFEWDWICELIESKVAALSPTASIGEHSGVHERVSRAARR